MRCVDGVVVSQGGVGILSALHRGAYHYVTNVDTDAEVYAAIRCETEVRFSQGGLGLHSALHGVNGAPELRKHTVARRVRYAAPVVPNEPVENCASFCQPLECADL